MRVNARKIRERLVRLSVRLTFRCVTGAALLGLLATLFPWPGGARPVMAASDVPQVICPDPILEGNSAHMQLRLRNHHSIGRTIFTYNGDFTADGGDYAGYDGVWLIGSDDSDSLFVPVVTHEDSQPEIDETFSIGFWNSGDWHGCVIKITDDDSPEITEVAITSKPTEGDRGPNGWLTNKPNDRDTYRAGESIDVTVTFDRAVQVAGTPTLSLYVGDSDGWRGASYHSGSGTDQLVFRYQVRPTDRDHDGVSVGSARQDEDRNPTQGFSGTILANGTSTPVHYSHGGLASASDHKVDGRPYAKRITVISSPSAGWNAYRANQIIEFAIGFDIDVEVHGRVLMDFYLGQGTEGMREATYVRGSDSDTLVFAYTVQPDDADSDGIQVATGVPESSFSGGGKITARGTDVEAFPYYLGTGPLVEHLVDTAAPSIESVSIRTAPADGAAYRAAEVVEVAVTFSEAVRIEGAPQLDLEIGGEARTAAMVSGEGSSDARVFRYTVADGDADGDGIGIWANSLRLNGGGIHDGAGNAAGLSHAAVAADEGQRVDASAQSQGE